MPHDWKRFPELSNSQMKTMQFESPHKQITESFDAIVVKVHDGDTITVKTDFRDFEFPIRFLDTNAPELNERGGEEVQQWLEGLLLNENVRVLIERHQRVGKWGRLLGTIIHNGLNVNKESIRAGKATPFDDRDEGVIPSLTKFFKEAEVKKDVGRWLV